MLVFLGHKVVTVWREATLQIEARAQVSTWTRDWHLKRELGAEEGLVVVSRLYL